ncbi:MAG: cadherin-like beta sandwich domain-containing protein [Lachnospiraceae bacterium]|nr:cadherin-like beta sandwich domain-containing protein [Lachnospiraceae bacterium]
MKQTKKKLFGIVTAVVMFFVIFGHNSMSTRAEDVSVIIALSSSSVSTGDGVTVTISVNGGSLSAYTMYVSYSSNLLQFNSGSGAVVAGGGGTVTVSGTGAGTITLSFTAIAEGQASVSTSSAEFYDINGTQLSVAHAGVVISVGGSATTEQPQTTTEQPQTTEHKPDDDKSDNSNLVRLQVMEGILDPEFVYYKTSYTVQLDKNVTSIGVVAEAEHSKAKVQINGADELKPGENIVTVVVTAENGTTKTYTIRAIVGELLENVQVEIDGINYSFASDIGEDDVPEGYLEITVSYGDWNIVAYESPNKRLVLVGMKEVVQADEGEDETADASEDESRSDRISWFIYDVEGQTFVPYEEILAANNRYVILDLPEGVMVPDGYKEAELTIKDKIVAAYHSEYATDEDIYLIYAMNIYGEEGFYLYDCAEETFMRYAPDDVPVPEIATVEDATVIDAKPVINKKDENKFTNMILLLSLIGCICLLAIFVVLSFVQISKKRQLREELDLAESMVEQLVASNNANRVGALKPAQTVQEQLQPEAMNAAEQSQQTEETNDAKEQSETENAKAVKDQPETEDAKAVQEQPEAEDIKGVWEQSDVEQTTVAQAQSQTEALDEVKESRKEKKARKKSEKKLRKAAKKEALKEDYSEEIINTMAGVTKDDLSDEQIDHIPEIVLEDYEEKSKEIQEKINGDYDADQDSAFAQTDNTDN